MKYLFVTDQELTAGYHGWFLKEISKLGIQTADCEFLALVDGYAPSGPRGKVTAAQVSANASSFYPALRKSEALVIVPMGPEAFRAVTGRDLGIEQGRGYIYGQEDLGLVTWKEPGVIGAYKRANSKKGISEGDPRYGMVKREEKACVPLGALVVPTYSIQYVMAKRKKPFYAFCQDIRRAKRLAEGVVIPVDQAFNRDRTFSTRPVKGWAPRNRTFAFDIETPMDARDVRQISLSDGYTTMALMWDDEVRDYVRPYLADPAYVKIAHNSMFDVPRLRDAGAPVNGLVFDTMIGGQLVQPDLPKALGKMASVYLDATEWKSSFTSDPDFYSAKDAFMTARLYFELQDRLGKLGMDGLAHQVMTCLPILLDMHERGIRVDKERVKVWCDELMLKVEEATGRWMDLTLEYAIKHGVSEVKPGSSVQVQKLFYKWMGLEVKRNKTDGVTVDAEAIFDLKRQYPQHTELFDALTTYRKYAKLYKTYAESLAGLDESNPRVHPQYLPGSNDGETFGRKGSASTGRLGVSRPNIQNQPPESRKMFLPEPGHQLVEFDFSQAELRVIAAVSKDEALKAALASSDIHQHTADSLGIPRPIAKNTIYATCYFGGATTIQTMMKKKGIYVEIPTIKRAQALIKQKYQRMTIWQQRMVSEGSTRGFIVNPFGRVRFFYDSNNDGPEMADFIPQSTVADITWELFPVLDQIAKDYGGRLVTQVHDSFLFSIPEKFVRKAAESLREELERPFDEVEEGFYLPTTMKIGAPGASWGELEAA